MADAPERFTLHLSQDGALRIEIGHDFEPGDIAALVAAENALHAAVAHRRETVEEVVAAG